MQSRLPRNSWIVGFLFFIFVFSSVLFFRSGCSSRKDYNILLLTLDTTRADRLRCYGYRNVETPALNRLAKEGVLFGRAYSPVPLTLPAHASILTGTFPTFHQIRDNGRFEARDDLITIGEVLKENGYITGAFISAAVLKKMFKLDQGFDFWDEEGIEPQPEQILLVAERTADKTTDAVINWLIQHQKEKWFLWVHYYDPHSSYTPPSPFKELYFFEPYVGEIAFMDSQISRLFKKLEELDLWNKTIIVAVGDHGESLGEHNELTHAHFIYEVTQRVPLIFRVPGLKNIGKSYAIVVSICDIMPTILDLISVPIPKDVQGRSLKSLLFGKTEGFEEEPVYLESYFTFYHFGWSKLSGLVTRQYKYIRAPKPELYDLTTDFMELKNLADEKPKVVKELESKLDEIEKRINNYKGSINAEIDGSRLDSWTRDQLLSLGYLGGGVKVDEERSKTKNPMELSKLMPLLNELLIYQANSKFDRLIKTAERVLKEDPENIRALKALGNGYFGLGEYRKAIEAIDRSVVVLGDYEEAHYLKGQVYIRTNQLDKAKEEFEKSLEFNPDNPFSQYYLGRILLLTQDGREKARELFSGEKFASTALGHIGMALYYIGEGRLGRAEAEYERAMDIAPDNPLVKAEYAQFLIRNRRPGKALKLLEEAAEQDKSFLSDPRFKILYEEAKELERQGVSTVPHNEDSLNFELENK